jgi:hypothetical protein
MGLFFVVLFLKAWGNVIQSEQLASNCNSTDITTQQAFSNYLASDNETS